MQVLLDFEPDKMSRRGNWGVRWTGSLCTLFFVPTFRYYLATSGPDLTQGALRGVQVESCL